MVDQNGCALPTESAGPGFADNMGTHIAKPLLAEGRAAWAIPWPCVHEFYNEVMEVKLIKTEANYREALANADLG